MQASKAFRRLLSSTASGRGFAISDRVSELANKTLTRFGKKGQIQQLDESIEESNKVLRLKVGRYAQYAVLSADDVASEFEGIASKSREQMESVPEEQKSRVEKFVGTYELHAKMATGFSQKMKKRLETSGSALADVPDSEYAHIAQYMRMPMGQLPAKWTSWTTAQLRAELQRRSSGSVRLDQDNGQMKRSLIALCKQERNDTRAIIDEFLDKMREERLIYRVVRQLKIEGKRLPVDEDELREAMSDYINSDSSESDSPAADRNKQIYSGIMEAWLQAPYEATSGAFGLLQVVREQSYLDGARSIRGPKKKRQKRVMLRKQFPGAPKEYY